MLDNESPLLQEGLNVDQINWEWRQGAWIEPRFNFNSWRVLIGLRYQSMPLEKLFIIDPRGHVYYDGDLIKLNAGIGRYRQMTSLGFDTEYQVSDSIHASSGLDIHINDKQQMGADLWWKSSENVVFTPVQGDPFRVSVNSYGGELFWNVNYNENLLSRLAVSSMKSRVEGGFLTWFDQPLSLNTLVAWEKNGWNIGLRYRYSIGLPIAKPIDSIYISTSDIYLPVWEVYPSDRLPNYQKIDLHLAHKWTIKSIQFYGYCEVWYIPKISNYLYPIYSYNYEDSQMVIGPGLVPLVGFRTEL